MKRDRLDHAAVVAPSGDTTHVLVPKADYDRLTQSVDQAAIDRALATLDNPRTKWHDADDVVRELLASGLATARKARGLSQARLAELLGVAQPQVSRYERKPDSMTVKILKKIAITLASAEAESKKEHSPRSRPRATRK